MPHPSRRLDLFLVPADADNPPDRGRFEALQRTLAERDVLDDAGAPGPHAERLVDGGFAALRFEEGEGRRLYANQQGGFRVRCPACGANLVPALHANWSDITEDGGRELTCPECGGVSPVIDLQYEPPAAWGRWAVRVADAGSASLHAEARRAVEDVLGPVRVVARRVA